MKFTLKEIAAVVNGKLIGDSNIVIEGVSEIQNGRKGTISFLGNQSYKKYIDSAMASAIIVSDVEYLNNKDGIVVKNPQLAIAKVLNMFFPDNYLSGGVHTSAVIDSSAKIGKKVTIESGVVIGANTIIKDNTFIGANSYIGSDTIINKNSKIYQNVVIYHDIEIGKNSIIHSSAVIGSDGFGFVTDENNHFTIPQTGKVIIGDQVEIGSNTVIDRATIGKTIIGNMTKIDNLVHIGHNVEIGSGCLITAQVGIAGSAKIGDGCIFGGQAGVVPHITLGPNSVIAAKSGVTKSLAGNQMYGGYPARPIREQHKRDAIYNEIVIMKKKLNKLTQT